MLPRIAVTCEVVTACNTRSLRAWAKRGCEQQSTLSSTPRYSVFREPLVLVCMDMVSNSLRFAQDPLRWIGCIFILAGCSGFSGACVINTSVYRLIPYMDGDMTLTDECDEMT